MNDIPAMDAVRILAENPANSANSTKEVISFLRFGAIMEKFASCIPTEPKLQKPQRAYVAIVLPLA